MINNFILITLVLLASIQSQAFLCSDLLSTQRAKSSTINDIDSPDDFFEAMTKGMVLGSEQEGLFGFYRTVFGNPSTNVGKDLTEVHRVLDQYPSLLEEKTSFREVHVDRIQKEYPITDELRSFVSSLLKSSGQLRSNLFNIEANIGYWKKILMPPLPKRAKLSQEEKQALNQKFYRRLNFLIPADYQTTFKDTNSDNYLMNTTMLIRKLKAYESWLVKRQKPQSQISAIRQAIVDTMHSAPFFEGSLVQLAKSDSALEVISALTKLMDKRDEIAMNTGFSGHFAQVVEQYNSSPTGLDPSINISSMLRDFEVAAQNLPFQETVLDSVRVRPLSIMESPFRSCLGGSDCSSRTYFEKALDPNYYYFTITKKDFSSSGHITIVLGEAKNSSGQPIKVAFIDKIQNIDNSDIPWFLEAIRQSVADKGYVLTLPFDVGGHNGLSNVEGTRNFVKSSLISSYTENLNEFTPFHNNYNFENRYSRAYSITGLVIVEPLSLDESNVVRVDSSYPTHPAPQNLTMEKLVEPILKLGRSETESELLQFIALHRSIEALTKYGVNGEQYWRRVEELFYSTSFDQVKKQALYSLLTNQHRIDLLTKGNFSPELWQNILGEVQQWKNSSNPERKTVWEALVSSATYKRDKHSMEDLKILITLPWFDVSANIGEALTWASIEGRIDIVSFLLSKDEIDVDAHGEFTLFYAGKRDRFEIVKLFFSYGIGVEAKKSALEGAAQEGHIELVKWLLSQDYIDQNAINRTFLRASLGGDIEVVKLLLSRDDIDVNTSRNESYSDATALQYASARGSIEIVKLLLSRDDIDVNAGDGSALVEASENGHFEIVKLLESYLARKQ